MVNCDVYHWLAAAATGVHEQKTIPESRARDATQNRIIVSCLPLAHNIGLRKIVCVARVQRQRPLRGRSEC